MATTLNDLRGILRDECDKPATILTDARCLRFVRRVIERMVNAHDWQGQGKTALLTYDATTDGLDLPVDFISEKTISQIVPGASDPSQKRRPIPKLMGGREGWLSSFSAASSSARSAVRMSSDDVAYYLWAQKLYLVPNPSGPMQVELDYIEALQQLPDDALASNVLMQRYGLTVVASGALREAELFLHRWDRAKAHEEVFQGLLDGALKRDMSTRLSGPKHQRGA